MICSLLDRMLRPGWAAAVGKHSSRPDERRCRSEPNRAHVIRTGRGRWRSDRPRSGRRIRPVDVLPHSAGRPARLAALVESSCGEMPAPSKRERADMGRLVYELRVRGPVPPELLEEIGAEDFGEEPPLTVLRTEPTDQPGLHGLLQRVRSLGLDLIEVRPAAAE